jgi:hypothetical protein
MEFQVNGLKNSSADTILQRERVEIKQQAYAALA